MVQEIMISFLLVINVGVSCQKKELVFEFVIKNQNIRLFLAGRNGVN